ncbi:MAG: phage terminase small subunit P27 family [Prevotellaceae bacterium]|jgi:P27 family predicted phage terminase small subunit|nr:phage terminase small subunit P27 family [Prevotellaceae bacterium]
MMMKFNMPDGLSEETKKFITDVIRELNKREIIESIDHGAMRMLATSYEMYVRASNILIKEGPVIVIDYSKVVNPAQTVATKSYAQVIKIMTEYGLTVRSRSHIKEMNAGNSDTPLDSFFKRRDIEMR